MILSSVECMLSLGALNIMSELLLGYAIYLLSNKFSTFSTLDHFGEHPTNGIILRANYFDSVFRVLRHVDMMSPKVSRFLLQGISALPGQILHIRMLK
jgi:hypothetical protein